MIKTVVTLQELTLLTMISRRLLGNLIPFSAQPTNGLYNIADILMPKRVQGEKDRMQDEVVGKYLPYTGVYFLNDISAVNELYRIAFLGYEQANKPSCNVWQTVRLLAYPFELALSPSFTMLLEMRVNADFMNHASAHTLLKISPTTVYLSPDSSFHVLVDNALQETVNREYVDTVRLLDMLGSQPGVRRYDFINALLIGDDPITAVYEATERPKKQDKKEKVDFEASKVIKAQQMSEREDVMGQGSIEEMWSNYADLANRLREMSAVHPTLIHVVPKPKKRGA
ncbi:MAG: hypothetical protein MN733_09465, partial [Nitrososphaera sp.]|nr:hypothetical protein [Nitrososphaera sp.]